jgi:hypothetical protein
MKTDLTNLKARFDSFKRNDDISRESLYGRVLARLVREKVSCFSPISRLEFECDVSDRCLWLNRYLAFVSSNPLSFAIRGLQNLSAVGIYPGTRSEIGNLAVLEFGETTPSYAKYEEDHSGKTLFVLQPKYYDPFCNAVARLNELQLPCFQHISVQKK